MNLGGKTVFITGAGKGIGKAISHRCAKEGAEVIATDIDLDLAKETAEEVNNNGDHANWYELDVRNYERFKELLVETAEDNGIDVLVNNAGIGGAKKFTEISPGERDEVIDVNIGGVWNGTHAAIPLLLEDDGGSIINIASIAGFLGWPLQTTYCLTKGAILNFSRSIAVEFASDGIRTNAICPGTIQTDRLEQHLESRASNEEQLEKIRKIAKYECPMKRFGEPEEIASCVAFLASEDASFVNGHGFVIDGGYSSY